MSDRATEAAAGGVLLVATLAALVLANSGWSEPSFVGPLRSWIDDGLMTIFFFSVGLEIRGEIHAGVLSSLRRAALPVAAALGGMVVPSAIYAAFNAGRDGSAGWGIPMATDIAFAAAALTLLGSRVPPALRVVLLALAVIDDIGAIAVIAIFYSDGVAIAGLAIAVGGVAAGIGLRACGRRHPVYYVVPAIAVWVGLYRAGIHPTLAGVVVGMLIPTRSATLHLRLRPWVAFAIMPLFALANAGVSLGGARLAGDASFVFVGILAGLVLGKPLGVFAASRLAIASRLAARPGDVTNPALAVIGAFAGVGFTMSLFIAQLAFPPGPLLATAKLAILAGSTAALISGALVGRITLTTSGASARR